MALPRHIFTPAFRHQRLNWFFGILVGIMVYVATFAMTTEASLSVITFTWDKSMETRMTVEIPAVDDESSASQSDRIQQTISVLRAMPDITRVDAVPESEINRLLKPWINQPELVKEIPVPALIDIERKPGSNLTTHDIESALKGVVENIHVDDHAAWLADMTHLVRGLAMISALMIILTAVILIICVSLMCRAIMATERETLSLLHVIGAEDNDIAQHFQFHAEHMAWPAAWTGFGFAILSAGMLLFFLRHFADPSLVQPVHWLGLAVAILAVPLLAIWIAAFSARLSTLKFLHAMP